MSRPMSGRQMSTRQMSTTIVWTSTSALVLLIATGATGLGCDPLDLDSFLYDPVAAPPEGYQLSRQIIPNYEELFLDTQDGQRLHIVRVPPANRTGRTLTLVYFHGASSNIGTSWQRLEYLYPTGHEIYAVEPRGYGLSTGKPSEAGLQADLVEVHRFLVDVRGVRPGCLAYYGRSLGGALAIHLASLARPAALITESTFTSVAALIRDGVYVDLPAGAVTASAWNSIGKLPFIQSPYLILHGTDDNYVSFRYARQLAVAHGGSHELEAVAGATHSNIPEIMGLTAYESRVGDFLDSALADRCPPP
jgi:pimeloyl-ACP methyl ester carboxylesterase